MTLRKLMLPDGFRLWLKRRYETKRGEWLAGGGTWPLVTSLGAPREKDVQNSGDLVRQWVKEWDSWCGSGYLVWQERQWPIMGTQRIPKSLTINGPDEVAACIGMQEQWHRAVQRCNRFVGQWPSLKSELPRHFDMLADSSEEDCNRLYSLLTWLVDNPDSKLYPRQLPIPRLDSKWLEKRRSLVMRLLSVIQNRQDEGSDFYRQCGLTPLPNLVRVRLLSPELRRLAGGLSDITAPLDELVNLSIKPRCVAIVENQQTALAFGELSGTVLVMGLGYAVEVLAQIPWLSSVPCIYWGDLDTHGFAILNRARGYLPQIVSCLMDEDTLLMHRELWVEEPSQHAANELPNLTPTEQNLYQGLKSQRWGINVRLEQERIYWPAAWNEIQQMHSHILDI